MEAQHKNQVGHGPVAVQHSLLEHIARKVWQGFKSWNGFLRIV